MFGGAVEVVGLLAGLMFLIGCYAHVKKKEVLVKWSFILSFSLAFTYVLFV